MNWKQKLSEVYHSTRAWLWDGQQRLLEWWHRQSKPRLVLYTVVGGAAFTVLSIGILFLLVYTGALGRLPGYDQLREIETHTASEVYSADQVLLGKYYVENRILADFEEIPPHLIDALVSTEDARFFEHSGVDTRALIRVAVKTVLLQNEASGGGSTLSQQLAKNLFGRKSYRILSIPINKFREFIIARRLEKQYSKEELLRLYLNTVPFGDNAFGVKVASRRFFNKPPEDLSVTEAATLVGMLKANTYYNPRLHPDHATERRNTVLRRMAQAGIFSQDSLQILTTQPIELDYLAESHQTGLATHFRAYLRQEIEDLLQDYTKPDGTPYNLYTDGLKIYTSLDARMQSHAEAAFAHEMPLLQQALYDDWDKRTAPWETSEVVDAAVQRTAPYRRLKRAGASSEQIQAVFDQPRELTFYDPKQRLWMSRTGSWRDSISYHQSLLRAGMLVADPATGTIKVWIGGTDFQLSQYDQVRAERQAGSTFKPIVYATALENGVRPCEYFNNDLVTYSEYDNWQPRNSDGKYGGVYSMAGGLSNSVNAVTVQVMQRTGPAKVAALAREMGIEQDIQELGSIALGAEEVNLMDLVRVYSTIQQHGKRPILHYLDSITTAAGALIVAYDPPDPATFKQALRPEVAHTLTHMLTTVVDSGTARRLRYEYGLRGALAGKTGTTQQQSDGWFAGFTPRLVGVSWVGADNPAVHFRTLSRGQGGNTALRLWGRFFREVSRDKHLKDWQGGRFVPPPDTTIDLMQCPAYLEQRPPLADYWLEHLLPDAELIDLLGNTTASKRPTFRVPMRRPNETDASYNKRVNKAFERFQRRRARRERAKKKFENLFFKKQQ